MRCPRCTASSLQGLANENQRLQSTVTQLQRELAARESELAIRSDEIASLREAQRSAQSQINQYISDLQVRGTARHAPSPSAFLYLCALQHAPSLEHVVVVTCSGVQAGGICWSRSIARHKLPLLQAYERQFDSLSRAMHRSDNMAEGLDQERQALLDQLRAAEQVRQQLFVHDMAGMQTHLPGGKLLAIASFFHEVPLHSIVSCEKSCCRCALSWNVAGRHCSASWHTQRAASECCRRGWQTSKQMQNPCGSVHHLSRLG